MTELDLLQKAEQNELETALMSGDRAEIDRSLTTRVSPENISQARSHLYDELMPRNPNLKAIYDKIMGFLLDEMVVAEGKLIPRRIITPSCEEESYINLYLSLIALDRKIEGCEASVNEKSIAQTNILQTRDDAYKRAKRVGGKIAELKKTEKESLPLEEKTRIEKDLERYGEEQQKIDETLERLEKGLERLGRQITDEKTSLAPYYQAVIARAKVLGLEACIKNEQEAVSADEASIDFNGYKELKEKAETVEICFEAIKKAKIKNPESKWKKLWSKWKNWAVAAGFVCLIGGITGYTAIKNAGSNKKNHQSYQTPLNFSNTGNLS